MRKYRFAGSRTSSPSRAMGDRSSVMGDEKLFDNIGEMRVSKEMQEAIKRLKVKNEVYMTVDGVTIKHIELDDAKI